MEECGYCGEQYQRIAQHWAFNETHRPKLTEYQHEVAKGLILGDGNVNYNEDSNPTIRCNMTNKPFLNFLDDVFGQLSLGVKLLRTAEQEAKRNRDRGWSVDADPGDYRDIYHWESRRHPGFREFEEWYATGEKRFPEDLELTPTAMKVWYVGDGCLTPDSGLRSCAVALNNERGNKQKILSIFDRSPVPSPSIWYEGDTNTYVRWDVESGSRLFESMGDPLPGFDHKWPE